jgi:hypothetical protein
MLAARGRLAAKHLVFRRRKASTLNYPPGLWRCQCALAILAVVTGGIVLLSAPASVRAQSPTSISFVNTGSPNPVAPGANVTFVIVLTSASLLTAEI